MRLKKKQEKMRRKHTKQQRMHNQRTQPLKLPKLLRKLPLMRRLNLLLMPMRPKKRRLRMLQQEKLLIKLLLLQEMPKLKQVVNFGPPICLKITLVDTFRLKFRILDGNWLKWKQENTITNHLTLTLILIEHLS